MTEDRAARHAAALDVLRRYARPEALVAAVGFHRLSPDLVTPDQMLERLADMLVGAAAKWRRWSEPRQGATARQMTKQLTALADALRQLEAAVTALHPDAMSVLSVARFDIELRALAAWRRYADGEAAHGDLVVERPQGLSWPLEFDPLGAILETYPGLIRRGPRGADVVNEAMAGLDGQDARRGRQVDRRRRALNAMLAIIYQDATGRAPNRNVKTGPWISFVTDALEALHITEYAITVVRAE